MKALITGVEGFTGRYLADLLTKSGYEVFGLTRYLVPVPHANHTYACDLLDSSGVLDVITAVSPDVVIHLAGVAFVAHANVDEIYNTNLLGTRHLLDALSASGVNCRCVLLASSGTVYGNVPGVLTEETLPRPANDYAVSKLAMEYLAQLYLDRLPVVIVRPFNYTGAGQSLDFLIPKVVDHFRRRATTIELGNLDVARDFSDVRRVVEAYRRLLETPQAVGKTLNVCSGVAWSLTDLLNMVSRLTQHTISVNVAPAFVRQNEVKMLRGSCERLEKLVGPLPIYPIEETMRWMLDAHQKGGVQVDLETKGVR